MRRGGPSTAAPPTVANRATGGRGREVRAARVVAEVGEGRGPPTEQNVPRLQNLRKLRLKEVVPSTPPARIAALPLVSERFANYRPAGCCQSHIREQDLWLKSESGSCLRPA